MRKIHDTSAVEKHHVSRFAEDVNLLERLILAPRAGTFHPVNADVSRAEPIRVAIGDEVGVVIQLGEKHEIESPFTGTLLGLLVLPGERVRAGQPVAWLTTADW
jgi:biotin carboxyl carrier protein